MTVQVRRTQFTVEEIFHEGGPVASQPRLVGSAAAVIENPFAGRYVEDIHGFMEDLKPLGLELSNALVKSLVKTRVKTRGFDVSRIDGFGKGAIVGVGGEREHGALWHVPGGYAMRDLLGGAKAIVPSTKKIGAVGTRIDIPITHIHASYVRSHFDAVEVGVPGAPENDEMVLILVMSTGARIHSRAGGLKASEIKGEDGLR